MNDCTFICASVYVYEDLFIRDAFLRPNLLMQLLRYRMIVQLINVHKEEAYSAMETFVEKVVKKSTRMSDADIVLSTIHSAKGSKHAHIEYLFNVLNQNCIICTRKNTRLPICGHRHGVGQSPGTRRRPQALGK